MQYSSKALNVIGESIMSNAVASFTGVRVAGQPKYTRAYTKAGSGTPVAQKISIPCIVNNPPYVDGQGKLVETEKVLIFITAWGKLADTCAKYLPEGKEFDCDCNINSFNSRVIDPATGKAILSASGQPCVTIKQGYTMIPSSFRFGQDSAAQIDKEKRPVGWNGQLPLDMIEGALAAGTIGNLLAQAKQGPAMWEAKRTILKNLVFTPGMREFGAALVVEPEGAAQTAYAPLADQVAAATATVNGFTYDQMRAANWTDEQMLACEYASLVPKKAPAPPAPPATPPAPVAPPMEVIDPETSITMRMEAGSETAV